MKFGKCNRKKGWEKAVCKVNIIAKDKAVRTGVKYASRVVLAGIVIANPHLAPIQDIF